MWMLQGESFIINPITVKVIIYTVIINAIIMASQQIPTMHGQSPMDMDMDVHLGSIREG